MKSDVIGTDATLAELVELELCCKFEEEKELIVVRGNKQRKTSRRKRAGGDMTLVKKRYFGTGARVRGARFEQGRVDKEKEQGFFQFFDRKISKPGEPSS